MPSENPKCDEANGGCRHPWSFHRKKKGEKCGALGCMCLGFVGDPPEVEPAQVA